MAPQPTALTTVRYHILDYCGNSSIAETNCLSRKPCTLMFGMDLPRFLVSWLGLLLLVLMSSPATPSKTQISSQGVKITIVLPSSFFIQRITDSTVCET